MANNNLDLAIQATPSGTTSNFDSGPGMIASKPITKSTSLPSPIMARLAAAVAAVRSKAPSTKGPNGFLP